MVKLTLIHSPVRVYTKQCDFQKIYQSEEMQANFRKAQFDRYVCPQRYKTIEGRRNIMELSMSDKSKLDVICQSIKFEIKSNTIEFTHPLFHQ